MFALVHFQRTTKLLRLSSRNHLVMMSVDLMQQQQQGARVSAPDRERQFVDLF